MRFNLSYNYVIRKRYVMVFVIKYVRVIKCVRVIKILAFALMYVKK